MPKHTYDVITHKISLFENYFIILLERKLENQFPNATQNRESEFNVEHTSNSMLQSVDHLKRKQSPEQNQQGSLHQNHKDAIETSNQKKFRFATHQDRYAPTILLDAETISVQDQNKTWLKTLYIVNYVTNVSNRNNISWDNINRYNNIIIILHNNKHIIILLYTHWSRTNEITIVLIII